MLSGGDTRVVPIATHSMPTSPEARARKTDWTDAARLARAGRPALRGLHLTLLEDLPQVVGEVGLDASGRRALAGHEA